MNILVTGANGQLGSEMRLLGNISKNNYYFTDVAELDITDKQAIQEFVADNDIKIIINCAAYTAVEKAEDDSEKADLINHIAVRNLAEASKEKNIHLIHVSTDYVFGGQGNLPFLEDDKVNPLGVYGKTKLAGEKAIQDSGCKALIFRTAWLYSSFGNNFVKTMIKLTSEKESIKVVYDQTGSPTYAGDLAKVLFDIVETEKYIGKEGIYHFTNEGVISWYDFAIEIAKQAGNTACKIYPCRSAEFPAKVKRPAYSVLDKAKIKRTFDIDIPYWKDSLAVCMEKL
ncbi:MAG: dTDP-4-dehydrorhamnose reductase [Spirochaetia bacterium]|nr:dTDP-4-dehydrorhamnose reductase [Spirochaetia bacterium]MBR5017896.1 dTDP-4-dehydrorhamnose reductase [Spirochaetia bacterium]